MISVQEVTPGLSSWYCAGDAERPSTTVAQIARAWSFARQSVQRIADVLARDGLVVYEDNPIHRHARLMRLTAQGAATLASIQAAQRRWADELGEHLVERD
jgi:DNA-binding MarR family transcriptional regulator